MQRREEMKNKQKFMATAVLGVAFAVSTALMFVQSVPANTPATNGLYNGAFSVYAEEQDTATIGQTLGMKSVDEQYLLIATSFDVDDIANYSEVGYKISKDGAEAEKVGAGNQFYTGIVVKTGETTTKEYTLGDNIFADVVADGMIVAEIEYDATADYVIQPYLITNGGVETFVDVNVQHAHNLSVAVTAQPTSNKIASYGKLNTAGMTVTQTCSLCDLEEDVTANCTQDKYTTGDTVTFDYNGEKLTVAVEEVKGYEVEISDSNYDFWDLYGEDPTPDILDDKYKESGYISGEGGEMNIQNESSFYQGEYAGQTLNKISNFTSGKEITYHVWSDVAGYAEIALLASFNGYTVGSIVAAKSLNTFAKLSVNGKEIALPDSVKTSEFTVEMMYGMDFSEIPLIRTQLGAGWNTITITNVSGDSAFNTSTMSIDFVENKGTKTVSPASNMGVREEPTQDTLAGREEVGQIYLSGSLADGCAVGMEGTTRCIVSTQKGTVVTYYVYFDESVTADVQFICASSSVSGWSSDSSWVPTGVSQVAFGTDISVAVNGATHTVSDGAIMPEYSVETPSWDACRNFVTVDLMEDVSFNAGWNTISFTFETSKTANLAGLILNWIGQ